MFDPEAHPVAKGNLCGQQAGFNVHAATKVAANDEQGRLALCKYILRPPLARAWSEQAPFCLRRIASANAADNGSYIHRHVRTIPIYPIVSY
jgi:hypothetical protein